MAPTLLTIGLSPRGELSNKLEGKSPANGSGEPEANNDDFRQPLSAHAEAVCDTVDSLDPEVPFGALYGIEETALQKRPQHRSPEDIQALQKMLLKVKLLQELPPDALSGIAQHLGYRKLELGVNAITQGEEGREFFIILKGSVSVLVQDPTTGTESQIAVLGPGGSFGDLALMEPKSIRRASCQCREDTAFAVLHQTAYEQFIKDQNGQANLDKMNLLQKMAVFQHLPESTLRALTLVCMPREFLPNSVILQQDQEVEDVYILQKGHVKLIRELPRRSEVFDPDEFMPQDDPFKRQAAVSARFAHVASPVRTYIKQDPQKLRSAAERRRLVVSAHAKLQRAVTKIEQSRKSGFFMVLDRAVTENQTSHMTTDLAKAFQHATRCEVGDRLFLEIATAGHGEFFGEQCLSKVPKCTTSVIASTTASVLVLHKWDVLKMVRPEDLSGFTKYSVVGDIQEERLKEQFYRHLRWERFRTELVRQVLSERDHSRAARPAYHWAGFRSQCQANNISSAWK